MSQETVWVDYYHKNCGGLLFSHEGPLLSGTLMVRTQFKHPDGSHPMPDERPGFNCPKCGCRIPISPRYITRKKPVITETIQ